MNSLVVSGKHCHHGKESELSLRCLKVFQTKVHTYRHTGRQYGAARIAGPALNALKETEASRWTARSKDPRQFGETSSRMQEYHTPTEQPRRRKEVRDDFSESPRRSDDETDGDAQELGRFSAIDLPLSSEVGRPNDEHTVRIEDGDGNVGRPLFITRGAGM